MIICVFSIENLVKYSSWKATKSAQKGALHEDPNPARRKPITDASYPRKTAILDRCSLIKMTPQ